MRTNKILNLRASLYISLTGRSMTTRREEEDGISVSKGIEYKILIP